MTTAHDPLCPELWRWDDGQPCMFCALITRVREDERTNGDEGNPLNCTHSYKKAIRDALEVIDRFDDSNEYPLIVAAIQALDKPANI